MEEAGISKSERAMARRWQIGGHIVSGHIDGTGVIRSMIREENYLGIDREYHRRFCI